MELEVFRNGSNRPSSLTCGLHATLTDFHKIRKLKTALERAHGDTPMQDLSLLILLRALPFHSTHPVSPALSGG